MHHGGAARTVYERRTNIKRYRDAPKRPINRFLTAGIKSALLTLLCRTHGSHLAVRPDGPSTNVPAELQVPRPNIKTASTSTTYYHT